jgi:hypothetical protein
VIKKTLGPRKGEEREGCKICLMRNLKTCMTGVFKLKRVRCAEHEERKWGNKEMLIGFGWET